MISKIEKQMFILMLESTVCIYNLYCEFDRNEVILTMNMVNSKCSISSLYCLKSYCNLYAKTEIFSEDLFLALQYNSDIVVDDNNNNLSWIFWRNSQVKWAILSWKSQSAWFPRQNAKIWCCHSYNSTIISGKIQQSKNPRTSLFIWYSRQKTRQINRRY